MKGDKTLSVFVDESGRFKYPDPESHYYIVGLVFHDQNFDIAPLVRQMDRNADELGLDTEVFTFHAGPIIRQEKGYELMSGCHSREDLLRPFERNVLRKIKPKEI